MSSSKDNTIITVGDSQVNMITALLEIQHITSRLSSSIAHLEEFITKPFPDLIQTKVAMKQIELIDQ